MGYRPSPPPADPTAGAAAAVPTSAGRYGLPGPAPGAAHAAGSAGVRPRMSLDLARLQPPDAASPAGGQARRACLAAPVVRACVTWWSGLRKRRSALARSPKQVIYACMLRACVHAQRCPGAAQAVLQPRQGSNPSCCRKPIDSWPTDVLPPALPGSWCHCTGAEQARRSPRLRDRTAAVTGDARARAVAHTLADSAGPSAAQRRAGRRCLRAAAHRERPLAHAAARVRVVHSQARCAAALLCLAPHAMLSK